MSATYNLNDIVRFDAEERDYLLRRAEDHRQLAIKSDEPGTKSIHLRLKELYEQQANLITLVQSDHIHPQKD